MQCQGFLCSRELGILVPQNVDSALQNATTAWCLLNCASDSSALIDVPENANYVVYNLEYSENEIYTLLLANDLERRHETNTTTYGLSNEVFLWAVRSKNTSPIIICDYHGQ